MTTTLELVEYYANLLILQYVGKPRAYATIQAQVTPVIMPQVSVQEVTFALAPTSGTFVLSYDGVSSAAINWNDSAGAVQTKLRSVTGLSAVVVTGSIASQTLVVTFAGVTPPALLLVLGANSLVSSATPVVPVIAETDLTLPLAVQDGFNLMGDSTAVGAQLDVLGKYAGVTRTADGFDAPITLDDSDFLALIKVAIIKNSSGSSLATIQALLYQFFPGEIFVFDHADMRMDYIISTSVGSFQLAQLFVTEGVLPKPMGVQAVVIYAPSAAELFGFRTYLAPGVNVSPFNSYADYQTDWPWLTYANAVSI